MVLLRRSGAAVDRLLCRCLRSPDPTSVAVELEQLAALDPDLSHWRDSAAWHRVDPWAWLAVKNSELATVAAARELADRYDYGVARHLRMIDDLRLISKALEGADVSFAVFKGAVLAELAYPRPDLRAYNDLDVLVAPSSFGVALDALKAEGCQLLDRNWHLLVEQSAGQLHLLTPLGTVIDLHWNLINNEPARTRFAISTSLVLDRASAVRLQGVETRTLESADGLVHLCLHATLAGANRLCWLKDIAQVITTCAPCWDDVVRRSQEWNASVAVGTALGRTAVALEVAVPDEIRQRLITSRTWRLMTRYVDRIASPARAHRGGSLNRVVARAAQSGGGPIWVEFARRSVAALAKGSPLRAESHAWERGPEDPQSSLFATGSLAEYLRFVEAQPL